MVVTIIGSLSCRTCIENAVTFCKKLFGQYDRVVVHDPVVNNAGGEFESLLSIMSRYLDYIEEADLIMVVPKSPGVYGESTTYELAYAMKLGKPIVEFVSGGVV